MVDNILNYKSTIKRSVDKMEVLSEHKTQSPLLQNSSGCGFRYSRSINQELVWDGDLRGAEQIKDGLEKQGLYRVLRWKLQRLRAVPLCSQYQVDPLQVGCNHGRIWEP